MRPALLLAAGFGLALCACNDVLGMQRARLDEGDAAPQGAAGRQGTGGATVITPKGTGGMSGGDVYVKDCTAQSDPCATCLQNSCDLDTCMMDTTCRSALLNYTLCLDNNYCDNGSCTTRLRSTLENSLVLPYSCITACSDMCPATQGAIPTCNLYCSCMQDSCADQFKDPLGGSFDSCVQACQASANVPSIPVCRATHCEAAAAAMKMGNSMDQAMHCQHAVGELQQCTGKARICTDGRPTGFAGCKTGSDCCSNHCSTTNVCIE